LWLKYRNFGFQFCGPFSFNFRLCKPPADKIDARPLLRKQANLRASILLAGGDHNIGAGHRIETGILVSLPLGTGKTKE
jgi:hypothetical protein